MKKVSIGCLLALLVVVITGIIVYEIIRFCMRHFPPPPPPDPTNVVSAYFPLGIASPLTAAPGQVAEATFSDPACETTIELTYGFAGSNLVLVAAIPGTVDRAALEVALSPYQYATNSDLISYAGGVVTVAGNDLKYVVVENSADLFSWQPVFTNGFSASETNRLSFTGPCSNLFYRAVLYNDR